MKNALKIATVQHPVNDDIKANLKVILKFIQKAKKSGAELVHFPECNLSGYAGIDFLSFKNQDSKILEEALAKISIECKRLSIYALIGSHHFTSGYKKPFNSLYIINNNGKIIARYDKRHLTQSPETDHIYFEPGKEAVAFEIKGIKCGLLICHEWRYPEFYREYLKLGVNIIFQSFYDGGQSEEQYLSSGKELGELIMGAMKGNAANNYMWISACNTSRPESSYPSFVLNPDGSFAGKLKRNRAGMLITDIDLVQSFADPSKHWRKRIINH